MTNASARIGPLVPRQTYRSRTARFDRETRPLGRAGAYSGHLRYAERASGGPRGDAPILDWDYQSIRQIIHFKAVKPAQLKTR